MSESNLVNHLHGKPQQAKHSIAQVLSTNEINSLVCEETEELIPFQLGGWLVDLAKI